MPEHHHTSEVRFTLLPGTKYEAGFTDKHIIRIYARHISNYKILPRQKRQADTFGELRDLIAAVRAFEVWTM
jgi:hypothetical protein